MLKPYRDGNLIIGSTTPKMSTQNKKLGELTGNKLKTNTDKANPYTTVRRNNGKLVNDFLQGCMHLQSLSLVFWYC